MSLAIRIMQVLSMLCGLALFGAGLAVVVAGTFAPARGLGVLFSGVAVCLVVSAAPEAVPFIVGVARKLRARSEES